MATGRSIGDVSWMLLSKKGWIGNFWVFEWGQRFKLGSAGFFLVFVIGDIWLINIHMEMPERERENRRDHVGKHADRRIQ